MKLVTRVKLTGALMAGVVLTLASVAANAANTTAGTSIANKATVNYSVGGVSQPSIGSSPTGNTSGAGSNTTFLVDDKLALSVTTVDATIVSVSPGQTTAILVYQVTNGGNAPQGVSFSTLSKATGTANPFGAGTDDFDSTSPAVHVSQNNTATYVAVNDTASSIPQLAAGASNYVFVVASIPGTQVDGDIAVNALVAQVAVAGGSATYGTAPGADITTDDSANAWNPAAVQNIFADAAGSDDAANDGKSSSRDAWHVASAELTITKTSSVLTDPVHCTTAGNTGTCSGSNFKAIPGSVMQYTVTVANGVTALANASAISIADDLTSQITTNGYTAWFTGGMTVTTPGVNTGSSFVCADDGATTTTQAATGGAPYTAVTCDYNKTTATTVTVSGISLKPGDTATITYEVTIQ
ncbi:MAG: hypothetical protein ACRETO_04020 [Gammaproteobacteria bacterium]